MRKCTLNIKVQLIEYYNRDEQCYLYYCYIYLPELASDFCITPSFKIPDQLAEYMKRTYALTPKDFAYLLETRKTCR